MKLLIIISLIASSYAEKLDRAYLPPESAVTAGGSPGSLTAPGSQAVPGLTNLPSQYGQPISASLGQPSGPLFGQGPSQFGPQSASTRPGQPGFSQLSQQQNNQAVTLPEAGSTGARQGPTGFNQGAGSPVSGAPGFIQGSTRPDQAPTYGGQTQGQNAYSAQTQSERARASVDRNAEILSYYNENDGDTYAYGFETSNGISAEESGVATNGVRAKGSFAYTGDDGQEYRVTYTADENGYVPQGDHLPTPPPIPDQILKSLEDNARAAASGTQEGAYNPAEDLGIAGQQPQFGGDNFGQGQRGQISTGYQAGQDSSLPVSTVPGQQGYQNQGALQYSGPGSASQLPGSQVGLGSKAPYNAPSFGFSGIQSGQSPIPQYGTITSSPSSSSTPGRQGSSPRGSQSPLSPGASASQSNKSPDAQYSTSVGSTPGSIMPGQQGFSQTSGYKYNLPGSSPSVSRSEPQGLPVSVGQNAVGQKNAPSFSSSGSDRRETQNSLFQSKPSTASQNGAPLGITTNFRPSSQYQVVGGATGSIPSESNQFIPAYGAPNTTPQVGSSSIPRLPSLGIQNTGYNYKAPAGSSPSSPLTSGFQNYPSQGNQSPSQYGSSAKSPFATDLLNRPQGYSQTNQVTNSQNIAATLPSRTQGYQTQGNQSPANQYGSFPSQGSQAPQYGALNPGGSEAIQPKDQLQTGLNQRPQLSSVSSGSTGSIYQGTSGQRKNEGYQYNRPQSQFNNQVGSGFPRLPGTGLPSSGSSVPLRPFNQQSNIASQGATNANSAQGLAPSFSGNNYAPSGSPASGPTASPNVFGYSKPLGSTGLKTSPGSTSPVPIAIGQSSNFPTSGQYTPTGPTSVTTGPAGPGSPSGGYGTQYQPSQSNGANPGTAPYQYKRPESQSLSPGSIKRPFETQPGFGSNTLRQDNLGQVGSDQNRPSQTGYTPGQVSSQSDIRPSGKERPNENFGGPRQPPSFSPEEGYKY